MDRIESDGSFSTTLMLKPTGGSGAGAFDCAKVACAIRTIAAHTDADPRSARRSRSRSRRPARSPADAEPATATPRAGTPATPKAPASPRVTLGRKRLAFRVSEPGTVTAKIRRRVVRRVERGGRTRRVVRFRLVRTLAVRAATAGALPPEVKLPAGPLPRHRARRQRAGLKSAAVTRRCGLK